MQKGFVAPIILGIVILGLVAVFVFTRIQQKPSQNVTSTSVSEVPLDSSEDVPTSAKKDVPKVSIIATGLDTPWAIAFLPEGGLLVTERKGSVRLVSKDGQLQQEPVAAISTVKQIGEGGLHGITLHPDFINNKYIYLYYTYGGQGGKTLNRVVRLTYDGSRLADEKRIVDGIPGASNHDGGRIKFGPDGFLYITTGDAQNPSLSQDKNALAGKILRVTDDGSPAPGNPFGNRTYSYGHRNPQGITWSESGNLYEVEHGQSATDEFNFIEPGKNYGWPTIRGDQRESALEPPFLHSGNDTWAPAGLAYLNGRFFFAGLRGQTLYEVELSGNSFNLKRHFKGEFGRLREVVVGPDGLLYVTTSNRDGRGSPKEGDDKILRINLEKL